MNTKFADKVCRVFFIFVFVLGTISVPHQIAKAQELNFHVAAMPDSSWVQASGWPLGALITMAIDDPSTPQQVDYTTQSNIGPNPQNPNELIANFNLGGKFILKDGHVITMTDGSTTRSYTVTQLQVISIDLQNDTVSGIATPNAQIQVCASVLDHCVPRTITANGSGDWMVDYHIPGTQSGEEETVDLKLDANGVVSETDANGNWTGANWETPLFTAFPENNFIKAERWPVGSVITINIDNPSTALLPDFTTTQIATANTSQFYGRGGTLHYQPTYNFSAGDTITLTDGITTKSLVVSPVRVTSIDLVNDCITGITNPDRKMWVVDNNIMIQIQSDSEGNWIADFTGKTDLQLDKAGGIKVFDEDGDRTHVDVPNPSIEASMNSQGLRAHDWLLGTVVTLTIDRPSTPQSPDYTTSQTVGPASWNPDTTAAEFNLNGTYPFQVGDLITVSGGTITKTLIITNVAVTGIDPSAGTIAGIADPGAEIHVELYSNNAPYRKVTADGNGQWIADFSVPWNDQGTYDLKPGLGGDAANYDNDGDWVYDRWNIYNPYIEANVTSQWLHARDWLPGTFVTLTIDSPSTLESPDYSASQMVGPATWDPNTNAAEFYLNGTYSYQTGDLITVSDGTFTKTLIVTNIAVTGIDPSVETISGIADPGAEIRIEINGYDTPYQVNADGTGQWTADFTGQYDLKSGDEGRVQEFDSDEDYTVTDWRAPNPMLCLNLNYDHQEESIWSMGWSPEATVTLEIDNSQTTQYPDYSATQTGELAWWSPPTTFAWFNLQGVFNIQPSYHVRMSDGTYIRTMDANLSVTSVNVSTDTVSGTADPWAQVNVTAGDASRHVMADFAGRWIANFALVGTHEDEQTTFDIVSDTTGVSDQWDEDGDCINFSWRVPSNQTPVAEAGPNQTTYEANTVTLDATASSDPDGDALTYAWNFDNDGLYDDATGVTVQVSFSEVGEYVIGLQVTDVGGLSDTDTATVTILPWTLKGFYQPVDMNGVYNLVKGGSTVPLKFEIFAGSTELTNILDVKSLTYVETACDLNAVTDEVELTATGGTSLRYDTQSGQFIYNWKTPMTAGKCYRVTMMAMDGSSLVAYFKLK